MNLYRVNLQGCKTSITSKSMSGAYVVAETLDSAYNQVRQWLDKEGYGWEHERDLESIELLAETYFYGSKDLKMLFIQDK